MGVFDEVDKRAFCPKPQPATNSNSTSTTTSRPKAETLRGTIQKEYPQDKKRCVDRFVWLSLHFDGISTTKFGAGKMYEVLSVEIKNTPDVNRSLRRFCCIVAILDHEHGSPTADQSFIGAVHPILQSIVVSGLLGQYYYYNNEWLHVRWGVLVLSGDTKTQEIMSGYTGKQRSKEYSLYFEAHKQVLDVLTGCYHPTGRNITNHDAMLRTFESPWNRLHPSNFIRFLNLIGSGDEKALKKLLEKADDDAKKEVKSVQDLLSRLKDKRGWHPTTYPPMMQREAFFSLVLDAIHWSESTKNTDNFPTFQEVMKSTRKRSQDPKRGNPRKKRKSRNGTTDTVTEPTTEATTEPTTEATTGATTEPTTGAAAETSPVSPIPRKRITTIHDFLKYPPTLDAETAATTWSQLVDGRNDLRESKDDIKSFFVDYLKFFDVVKRKRSIFPFDRHFPILPGCAFCIDGMHVGNNFSLKMAKLVSNVGTKTSEALRQDGFDDFATGMRDGIKASSCFEMDELILKRGVAKLREYLKRHPTYFPWLQPEMLAHGNMAKLISEKQFTMMFCIFFFAYDEFFFDERVFLINACFDCFSYLYTARRDFKEIAIVQSRLDAFLGYLDNVTYPGFLTPTVTNMMEMFNSIVKAGPSVTYANWGSESSYKTLIDNDMGGCNPCKTMTRRYNVLRISQLLLFNYYLARRVPPNEIGEESDWTNALLRDLPRGLVDPTNAKMVLVNLADDTRYYRDDSFVYKDLFFRQLRNEEVDLNAEYEEKKKNLKMEYTISSTSSLRKSLKWDGETYHSIQSRVNDPENSPVTELSVEQLEYAKDCIAVTTDEDDNPVVMLVVGYMMSVVNDYPYPEVVGIVLPTICGSIFVKRCHRALLNIVDPVFMGTQTPTFVRASMNRVHIDKAAPLPVGPSLFFFVNCLILRPMKRIEHCVLFRARKEKKTEGTQMQLRSRTDYKALYEQQQTVIREKDETIKEKDDVIRQKDDVIRQKDDVIREMDERIKQLLKEMKEKLQRQ